MSIAGGTDGQTLLKVAEIGDYFTVQLFDQNILIMGLDSRLDQHGKPVTDAMVSAEFVMAAMPAMKMPGMRMKTQRPSP